MEAHFFAHKVAASDEEWGRLVLLGSIEEMDDQPYVMFQATYEHSPQDVRLGQDKPYVEIGNQGWSWYGRIEHVTLDRDMLRLQMDESARAQMQNDGRFSVQFKLDDLAFGQLREKLVQIFENYPVLRSNAV
jgi:hypothetical protein